MNQIIKSEFKELWWIDLEIGFHQIRITCKIREVSCSRRLA